MTDEELKERMCDYYCRYSIMLDISQEDLDTICENCPLNFLN